MTRPTSPRCDAENQKAKVKCPQPSLGTMHETLYQEALVMSVNKNLLDVTTLLEFAHGTENVLEKARHIDRAVDLLKDVRAQLVNLGAAGGQ